MGASAAHEPKFLWLQHPSAQQYSYPCSCASPCSTIRWELHQEGLERTCDSMDDGTWSHEKPSPCRVCSSFW